LPSSQVRGPLLSPRDVSFIGVIDLTGHPACLPMMRPIARRILPGSVLASDPSSAPYGKSGTIGGAGDRKSIKLRTLSRTVEVSDDSSSTKNLADLETGTRGSRDHDTSPQRSSNGRNEFARTASRTVIERASTIDDAVLGRAGHKGIHVKNEMSVSYERI
jgi:hypothetical protein